MCQRIITYGLRMKQNCTLQIVSRWLSAKYVRITVIVRITGEESTNLTHPARIASGVYVLTIHAVQTTDEKHVHVIPTV